MRKRILDHKEPALFFTRIEGVEMSQTSKAAGRQSAHRTVLEVATNEDGTYQITFNEKVVGSGIPEKWLDDELCAKRGFWGEELASITRQLEECGRAILTL